MLAGGKSSSMKIHLHKNAKTTPAQRAFIQADSHLDTAKLAQKIGVSPTTVRKWKKRDSVYDRSHVPRRLPAVLTPLQETLVVLIRLCLRSGLDDLHAIVRRFIDPDYARSSLNRCLKRYGISRPAPLPVHPDSHSSITLGLMEKTRSWAMVRVLVSFLKYLVQQEFYAFEERR